MSAEHDTTAKPSTSPSTSAGPTAETTTGAGSVRQALRGKSYAEGALMLKPDAAAPLLQRHDDPAPPQDGPQSDGPRAPEMRDGQQNPAPVGSMPTVPVAVTGEITVNASASDVANQALVAMASGSTIERNTRARIVAGTHKLAYLEDLAVDPQSTTLLRGWGYDPAQFTVKLNPWTRARMIIQNNAAGFATGSNIVGSRSQSVSFWRTTLLCHEVSHIIHNDSASAADSFRRYKGEFRAYWVAGFHTVANLANRARQIKAHLLREYPLMANKYNTDATFKRQVDGHTAPDAGDNLTNATPGTP